MERKYSINRNSMQHVQLWYYRMNKHIDIVL